MKTDRYIPTLAIATALLAGLIAVAQPSVVPAVASEESEEPAQDETPAPTLPTEPKPPTGPRPPTDPRSPAPHVRPTLGLGFQITIGRRTSALAERLAQEVAPVQERFRRSRRELRIVRGADGGRAYSRQEVARLMALTGKDLGLAIERVGELLEPLSAWSTAEVRRIEGELPAPPGSTAASSTGFSTPRAVAVIASLGGSLLPGLASVFAAAPQQETISAERSDRLLDQIEAVIGRILFLAKRDDLEVELWVGSTPAPLATFRFWPQGQIRGSTLAPFIIRTASKRDHVLRGLYAYRAAWAKGPVTEVVEYPNPAGASAAGTASERLDLVNGSRFFCCRFNEQYCHHVANENDCRP